MAGMGIAAGCSARELPRRNIGSLAKYRVRTIALTLLPFAPAQEESCQHSNATSLAINLLNLATLLLEFNAGKGLSVENPELRTPLRIIPETFEVVFLFELRLSL